MEQSRFVSILRFWKTIFIVFAFCLASIVPFVVGEQTEAQTSTTGTLLYAPLTGAPIGGMTPRGLGRHVVESDGDQVFEVEVGAVNLAAGTMLNVLVNDSSVGQIRLSIYKTGRLRLSSVMGQTVPTVNNGSTITVKHGDTTIVTGVFGPPPSPSPSPSMTPFPTPSAVFFAPLTGATIDGVMPRGVSHYAEFGTSSRRLGVFVDNVNLPQGTQLDVLIGGNSIGHITLNQDGDGRLRLDTAQGHNVPIVTAGTEIQVKNGSTTILAGTYRGNTFPSPSPSVTPHPSPHPNRYFWGRLSGAQVVPPVQTQARGAVFVALNQAETQIHVHLAFTHLSSEQTSARIYGPAQAGETGPQIFDLGVIGGTSGRFPVRTFDVTPDQVAQLRHSLWYVQIGSVDHPDGEIRGQIRSRTRPSGFSGVETEDLAVYRPANGTWYVKSGTGYTAETLGQPGDKPVSADYDGDGRTDAAVYRDGTWLISRSSDRGLTTKQFGLTGDLPVRGDYDGDGRADLAVFRPSTGVWYVWKSNGSGYLILQFGLNGDQPVGSDFDGDGRTDIAVFRPSNGVWYWLKSSNGAFQAAQFGVGGDVPIAGDFDGDGADDLAVFRPSTGVWYVLRSSNGTYDIRQFGLNGDIPVAGNFDGDGRTDIAVFRPSDGVWYIWRSLDGTYDFRHFGTGGDIPTTAH